MPGTLFNADEPMPETTAGAPRGKPCGVAVDTAIYPNALRAKVPVAIAVTAGQVPHAAKENVVFVGVDLTTYVAKVVTVVP